jgi:hypothetical protein
MLWKVVKGAQRLPATIGQAIIGQRSRVLSVALFRHCCRHLGGWGVPSVAAGQSETQVGLPTKGMPKALHAREPCKGLFGQPDVDHSSPWEAHLTVC